METNKTKKYLLYAFGEIMLVVIGILIALQINNWNEEQKLRDISQETIENLTEELTQARESLTGLLAFNKNVVHGSELFITDTLPPDSLTKDPGLVFRLTNYAPATADLPILANELTSDRKIYDREELITQLRIIKNEAMSLDEVIFYLDEFWNSQVSPYFIRTRTMVTFNRYIKQRNSDLNLSDIRKIAGDDEYKNLVAMSHIFTLAMNEHTEELIISIEEALSIIEGI